MALGGNLKKKSLLPNDEGPAKDKETSTEKAKPKSSDKTKAQAESKKPAAKKAVAKKAPTKKATPKKGVAKKSTSKKTSSKKIEEVKAPEQSVVEEKVITKEVVPPAPVAVTPAPIEVVEQPAQEVVPAPVVRETKHTFESYVVEKPVVREGLVTKLEYERRQKLHEKFSEEIKSLDGKQVHLIVFRIENESFAIEIGKVNEVVVTPEITRMPQAPRYIPGMATIRGRGIVTLDLAYKLAYVDGLEGLKTRSEYTIVVKTQKFTVGVLVPEVPVSHIISGSNIQPAYDNISETSLDETYVKGLFRTEEGMVFFIDIDEMIEGDRLKSRLSE